MHKQRGQTLPVWIFGMLTMLWLMMAVFNYANALRWQIRAQNAADSVAQGIISVQAQHYNQYISTLHAAAIEEYRIRFTINGLLEIIQGSGGCEPGTGTVSGETFIDCADAYNSLRNNYIAEVNRYGKLVQQMAALSEYTNAQQIADMETIANTYENDCTGTGATGGDCQFTYTIVTPAPRDPSSLSGALTDAAGEDNGDGMALPNGGTIDDDFYPLQVEVDTCAKVSAPLAGLWALNGTSLFGVNAPFVALGRAAATSTMVTQEWFNPGTLDNPNSTGSTPYQYPEYVESSTGAAPSFGTGELCDAASADYDWYAVKWCANNWASESSAPTGHNPPGYRGYLGTITTDEFSTWTGFWSAVPEAPYNGTFTDNSSNCKQGVAWSS